MTDTCQICEHEKTEKRQLDVCDRCGILFCENECGDSVSRDSLCITCIDQTGAWLVSPKSLIQ